MAEQVIHGIMKQLKSDDREIGFIEYLPDEAQEDLSHAIGQYMEQSKRELDEATARGVSALPSFLRFIARSALK